MENGTYRGSHQATTIPHGIPLTLVCDDVDVHSRRLWEDMPSESIQTSCGDVLTLMWLPLACSEWAILPSTMCLMSRCSLLPKSLNMVEPPERTMF